MKANDLSDRRCGDGEQVERGTTATYLSSEGGNSLAMSRLVVIRRRTDRLIRAVDGWPDAGLIVSGNLLRDSSVGLLLLVS